MPDPQPGTTQPSPFVQSAPRPMPNQPENAAADPLTHEAVDSTTSTANATRLRDAAADATSAARKAGETARELAGFAELISTHIGDSGTGHLTREQVLNLRTEAEASVVALFRVVTDLESAKNLIDGLAADVDASSREFSDNSPNDPI